MLLLFDLKLLLKDAIFCMSLFKILVATFALYKRSMFFYNCNYSFCRFKGFGEEGCTSDYPSTIGEPDWLNYFSEGSQSFVIVATVHTSIIAGMVVHPAL